MKKHLVAAALVLAAVSAGTETTARANGVNREVFVADASRSPDLFIQTNFDKKAQAKILAELRASLKASTGFDPLNHRFFDKPVQFVVPLKSEMNDLIKAMLQQLINAKFEMLDALIEVEGVRYETPEASLLIGGADDDESTRDPELTDSPPPRAHATSEGLDLPVSVRLRKTKIVAEKIRISFRSNQDREPKTSTKKKRLASPLDSMFIELKDTTLSSENLQSLALDLTINARKTPDGGTKFSLSNTSFKGFEAIRVDTLEKELKLDFGDVILPYLSVNLGLASLPAQKEGLKSLLRSRNVQIAKLVFKPLVDEIKKIPEKVFKSNKDSVVVPTSMEFEFPCIGRTTVKMMQFGQIGASQLMLAFGLFQADYQPTAEKAANFSEAGEQLHDQIAKREVSTAFGLSDRFIAFALEKSIRGCVKDKIPPALGVGPSGARARMRGEDGGDGVLALHAQISLRQVEGKKFDWKKALVRAALGSPLIEFPIKLAPKLQFRSGGMEPAKVVLDMSNPDLSDETLRKGFDGIPSNVETLRLKKTVLKKMRAQLETGLANAKVEIPMKFLQSADVSFANIESDRLGHLELLLTLDPNVSPGAQSFWDNVAPYLRKALIPKTSRTAAGTTK